MVLPPLQQLAVGMPASLTGAHQTAEQRRDHMTYLLVARNELKKALKNLVRPEDPSWAYNSFPVPPWQPDDDDDEPMLSRYDNHERREAKRARDAMRPPPPNPEDVRRYEEELLPAYEARRGRLVDNLESVEKELPMWLSEGYQRMLQDLLE